MKIVIIINMLHRGGAERVVSRLTLEWSRSHDVVVALFSTKRLAYQHGGRIVDLRLPTDSLVQKVYRLGMGAARLALLFRQERPDRVVSFMESANFPAIMAASVTGLLDRLWISVRVNPEVIPAAYRRLIPWLYRAPARIVAPSEGVKEGLKKMGLSADKLHWIPNPVVAGCSTNEDSASVFPDPFVLAAGRLVPAKGFDRLLKAFALLNRKDLHLVVLGEGPEREALMALAQTLEIGSSVHFPGAVSNIEAWYRSAMCFVLSSRYEGWPNVLMEAMANGCPVISYDCKYGPEEIVEDGKSGLLVAQGDISGLAAEINRVIVDKALRRRLASEGVRRGKTFSAEDIAPQWLRDHPCRSKV